MLYARHRPKTAEIKRNQIKVERFNENLEYPKLEKPEQIYGTTLSKQELDKLSTKLSTISQDVKSKRIMMRDKDSVITRLTSLK